MCRIVVGVSGAQAREHGMVVERGADGGDLAGWGIGDGDEEDDGGRTTEPAGDRDPGEARIVVGDHVRRLPYAGEHGHGPAQGVAVRRVVTGDFRDGFARQRADQVARGGEAGAGEGAGMFERAQQDVARGAGVA